MHLLLEKKHCIWKVLYINKFVSLLKYLLLLCIFFLLPVSAFSQLQMLTITFFDPTGGRIGRKQIVDLDCVKFCELFSPFPGHQRNQFDVFGFRRFLNRFACRQFRQCFPHKIKLISFAIRCNFFCICSSSQKDNKIVIDPIALIIVTVFHFSRFANFSSNFSAKTNF